MIKNKEPKSHKFTVNYMRNKPNTNVSELNCYELKSFTEMVNKEYTLRF